MRFLNVRLITKKDTLLGRSAAKRDFPLLEKAVSAGPPGETIVWDWSEVRIATASYFAGTCVALFKRTLSGELDKYFVLSGLNDNSADELKLVLEAEQLVMLVADHPQSKNIESARPVGNLDQTYLQTFAEAVEKRKVSASSLFRHATKETQPKIGKTAWINRLSNLSRFRLLKRTKVGRQFEYEVPF